MECDYTYVNQPPENILCNPYGSDSIFKLQCALTTSVREGNNISINWFFNETIPLTDVAMSSTEDGQNAVETFTSTLTLTNLQPQTDTGDYYCRAAVDGQSLEPSKAFTLSSDEDDIFNIMILGDCKPTDIFSDEATRCADVASTTATEAVTTPSTTHPPQPSQTTLLTTVTPSQTAPGGGTTNDQMMTTTQSPETSSGPSDPPVVPETLQVWIYVLVGVAAVFGIIIVILSIMCIGLCVRKNKTQDSHTLKRE